MYIELTINRWFVFYTHLLIHNERVYTPCLSTNQSGLQNTYGLLFSYYFKVYGDIKTYTRHLTIKQNRKSHSCNSEKKEMFTLFTKSSSKIIFSDIFKAFLYSVPIYFLKHTFLNYLIIINTSGFKLRYFNPTEKTIKKKKKKISLETPQPA